MPKGAMCPTIGFVKDTFLDADEAQAFHGKANKYEYEILEVEA